MVQELTLQINPIELLKAGIRVYKAYQRPGEIVVNFPKCYHAGFNNGYNINEAVNLASPDWLSFGAESVRLFRVGKLKQIVFAQEYLIYQSATHAQDYLFTPQALKTLLSEF